MEERLLIIQQNLILPGDRPKRLQALADLAVALIGTVTRQIICREIFETHTALNLLHHLSDILRSEGLTGHEYEGAIAALSNISHGLNEQYQYDLMLTTGPLEACASAMDGSKGARVQGYAFSALIQLCANPYVAEYALNDCFPEALAQMTLPPYASLEWWFYMAKHPFISDVLIAHEGWFEHLMVPLERGDTDSQKLVADILFRVIKNATEQDYVKDFKDRMAVRVLPLLLQHAKVERGFDYSVSALLLDICERSVRLGDFLSVPDGRQLLRHIDNIFTAELRRVIVISERAQQGIEKGRLGRASVPELKALSSRMADYRYRCLQRLNFFLSHGLLMLSTDLLAEVVRIYLHANLMGHEKLQDQAYEVLQHKWPKVTENSLSALACIYPVLKHIKHCIADLFAAARRVNTRSDRIATPIEVTGIEVVQMLQALIAESNLFRKVIYRLWQKPEYRNEHGFAVLAKNLLINEKTVLRYLNRHFPEHYLHLYTVFHSTTSSLYTAKPADLLQFALKLAAKAPPHRIYPFLEFLLNLEHRPFYRHSNLGPITSHIGHMLSLLDHPEAIHYRDYYVSTAGRFALRAAQVIVDDLIDCIKRFGYHSAFREILRTKLASITSEAHCSLFWRAMFEQCSRSVLFPAEITSLLSFLVINADKSMARNVGLYVDTLIAQATKRMTGLAAWVLAYAISVCRSLPMYLLLLDKVSNLPESEQIEMMRLIDREALYQGLQCGIDEYLTVMMVGSERAATYLGFLTEAHLAKDLLLCVELGLMTPEQMLTLIASMPPEHRRDWSTWSGPGVMHFADIESFRSGDPSFSMLAHMSVGSLPQALQASALPPEQMYAHFPEVCRVVRPNVAEVAVEVAHPNLRAVRAVMYFMHNDLCRLLAVEELAQVYSYVSHEAIVGYLLAVPKDGHQWRAIQSVLRSRQGIALHQVLRSQYIMGLGVQDAPIDGFRAVRAHYSLQGELTLSPIAISAPGPFVFGPVQHVVACRRVRFADEESPNNQLDGWAGRVPVRETEAEGSHPEPA